MAEPIVADPVVVNGRVIAEAEIAAEMQYHPAGDAAAARAAAAHALAVRRLLLDEADRLGITAGELTDEDGHLLSEDDARIEALFAVEVRTPRADEATAQRYYDSHRARFRSAPLVEAEHILFAADPDDPLALGLAMTDARDAIRVLQVKPEAFGEIAQRHSGCPSKEQGGRLGQISPGSLVTEFEQVLFALAPGALHPQPVRTRFGVHVIRAGRREDARDLPFKAVARQIAEYLEEASWRRAVSQYIGILAGQSRIEGVEIVPANGPLVQ
ncbi:MAG: peptidylprolyl isomerase [Proteobacteria bacterium]|nr:peptidylprolyl isomerase [Pseudomonadota bacterium]